MPLTGLTYWPTSSRKTWLFLIFLLRKFPSILYCTVDNLLDLNSDHSSVLITINNYPLNDVGPLELFNATTDRFKFHNLVHQEIKLNNWPKIYWHSLHTQCCEQSYTYRSVSGMVIQLSYESLSYKSDSFTNACTRCVEYNDFGPELFITLAMKKVQILIHFHQGIRYMFNISN